ncbi:hypothetical protein CWATWH0401_2659 [Crocosphaera watsonii WH 0401]|uniref:Uncharacterized protein n=1 Tax=Crocosphaera watsonii WH 0401 TaxID=555881 RepID=T2JA53_CROWT|nr:hypothetical protein CWATWH0401_2659 [Crocosphaera watsonii WH 0401]
MSKLGKVGLNIKNDVDKITTKINPKMPAILPFDIFFDIEGED